MDNNETSNIQPSNQPSNVLRGFFTPLATCFFAVIIFVGVIIIVGVIIFVGVITFVGVEMNNQVCTTKFNTARN